MLLLLLLLLQFITSGMGVANCSFHEELLPNWAIHAWGRPWPVRAGVLV